MNDTPQTHPFEPVICSDSKILILGSFPSPDSQTDGFYYGNSRNNFWKLLEELFNTPLKNESKEIKIEFLKSHHIGLYDVAKKAIAPNSSDSDLKVIEPSPIDELVKNTQIKAIFTNGGKANEEYSKFFLQENSQKYIALPAINLPSTSPRNTHYTFDRLKEKWNQILEYLK